MNDDRIHLKIATDGTPEGTRVEEVGTGRVLGRLQAVELVTTEGTYSMMYSERGDIDHLIKLVFHDQAHPLLISASVQFVVAQWLSEDRALLKVIDEARPVGHRRRLETALHALLRDVYASERERRAFLMAYGIDPWAPLSDEQEP